MAKYLTKQRQALLDFLSHHAAEAFSPKQIAAELAGEGVSLSSVYRNLKLLAEEGLVRPMNKAGVRELFFQYLGGSEGRESLHLSCKQCGKTFPMNNSGAELLVRSVAEEEGFHIDKSDTVLYGVCDECRKN